MRISLSLFAFSIFQRRVREILFAAGVTFFALVLSGCWIPESFVSNIAVNKDGSYSFSYDGTLTFGLALAAASQGGLTPKDEADFAGQAVKLRQEPGFKRVDYQGKGRYKVLFEKTGKPGEPLYFVDQSVAIVAVLPGKNHTIVIKSFAPRAEDIQQLSSIGAKIDGTLTVSVANGVKVVKQNAESAPTFGLFGSYKWQIKSPQAAPMIVLQT